MGESQKLYAMLKKPDSEANLQYYPTYFIFTKRQKNMVIEDKLVVASGSSDRSRLPSKELRGILWGGGHVQHSDCDGGSTTMYVCQNVLNCTNEWILLYASYCFNIKDTKQRAVFLWRHNPEHHYEIKAKGGKLKM